MDEKKQYRVRQGFRFGAFDELGPGDVVELTEAESKGFLDKLERVVVVEPPSDPAPKKDK